MLGRRSPPAPWLTAVVAALAISGAPRPAAACSCVLSEGSGVERADLVFEGTVTGIAVHGYDAVTRFQVVQFWKGHVGELVYVEHPVPLNGNCGVGFDMGETYVLGVEQDPASCIGRTQLCALLGMSLDPEALGPGTAPGSGPGPLDADGGAACTTDGRVLGALLDASTWDGSFPVRPEAPLARQSDADAGFTFGPPNPDPSSPSSSSDDGGTSPESGNAGCACRVEPRAGRDGRLLLVALGALLGLRLRRRLERALDGPNA